MKWLIIAVVVFGSLTATSQSLENALPPASEPTTPIVNATGDSLQYLEIDRILIIGNEKTRESIIRRELSLKPGDIIFSEDLPTILEKDKRKIFNLRLFNTVDVRTLPSGGNRIDIIVEVTERWYTFPIPRFQLSDRNFNEWWENYNHDFKRVTYGVRLYQYNMRGRNETLLFTALFGFQKKFEVVYRIPYIDKKQKQGLIFEMDFSDAKNLAFRTFDHKFEFLKYNKLLRNTRGIGLTYTYRNSFYKQHRLSYSYRDTQISDTIATLSPNYLGDGKLSQRYDAIAYEFTSDHRDVIAYPLKGHLLNVRIEHHGVLKNDDLTKTEGYVSFAKFFDLNNNFFLSNYTYGYLSTPNTIPYYNYSAMGYYYTLVRGYEIYVIESPSYFLNKTTFKKRIFSTDFRWEQWPIEQFRYVQFAVYLKSFADFGYAKNFPNYTLNSRLSDKFIGGAGFGLDLVTSYDFVLRMEYTFTLEKTGGFFLHIKKEF